MKKNYVVNGAAHSGFGETTAKTLIAKGNKVFGLYERGDEENAVKLKAAFSADSLELICIDCTDLDDLKAKIGTIPASLDGFFNAYFVFDIEDVNNFDYNLAEKLFRANYHAPMLMAVELKKKMVKGASVVIVTSTESGTWVFWGYFLFGVKGCYSQFN
jgi:NAD(P)-dependent dehydrogenase (short-subunit alcohol dehydrogenase family)